MKPFLFIFAFFFKLSLLAAPFSLGFSPEASPLGKDPRCFKFLSVIVKTYFKEPRGKFRFFQAEELEDSMSRMQIAPEDIQDVRDIRKDMGDYFKTNPLLQSVWQRDLSHSYNTLWTFLPENNEFAAQQLFVGSRVLMIEKQRRQLFLEMMGMPADSDYQFPKLAFFQSHILPAGAYVSDLIAAPSLRGGLKWIEKFAASSTTLMLEDYIQDWVNLSKTRGASNVPLATKWLDGDGLPNPIFRNVFNFGLTGYIKGLIYSRSAPSADLAMQFWKLQFVKDLERLGTPTRHPHYDYPIETRYAFDLPLQWFEQIKKTVDEARSQSKK